MDACKQFQDKMANMYYSDLPDADRDQFMAHIKSCPDCNAKYAEIENLLVHMDDRFRPEPSPDFEERLWHDVNSAIHPKNEIAFIPVVWQKLKNYYHNRYLRYSLSFAVTMLVLGILIGKYIIPSESGIPLAGEIESTGKASFVRAERYIDRSKVLLLGILNHDPQDQMGLEHQRQISRDMIKEAAILKNELKDSENQIMSHLIAELEVILVQIASLESEYDLESVQLIQSGIEHKGLLFKIDLNQVITETQNEIKYKENNKTGI